MVIIESAQAVAKTFDDIPHWYADLKSIFSPTALSALPKQGISIYKDTVFNTVLKSWKIEHWRCLGPYISRILAPSDQGWVGRC